MAFELGFLVGTLLLLVMVLYVTRIRGLALPHTQVEVSNLDEVAPAESAQTQPCDICGNERICESVGDLTVCSECNDDLLT